MVLPPDILERPKLEIWVSFALSQMALGGNQTKHTEKAIQSGTSLPHSLKRCTALFYQSPRSLLNPKQFNNLSWVARHQAMRY